MSQARGRPLADKYEPPRFWLIGQQSLHLAAFRLDRDGVHDRLVRVGPQILDQVHPGSGILDQYGFGCVLRAQCDDFAPRETT
jgi:hypothetical protein